MSDNSMGPAGPGSSTSRRASLLGAAGAVTAGVMLAALLTPASAGASLIPSGAAPSAPPVARIGDSSDTFVTAAAPAGRNGDATILRIDGGTRTYLRFHVPAADAAAAQVVHLELTFARPPAAATVAVHSVSGVWTAKRLTWAKQPTIGPALAQTTIVSGASTLDVNVPAAAITGGTVSLAVTSPGPATVDLVSREGSGGAPALVFTLGVPGVCTTSELLVSSCQAWLGDAPQAYSGRPVTAALATDENAAQRRFDIVHQYNRNGQLFPSPAAIAIARQGRLLNESWEPATDMSWAKVAAGGADSRINAEAAYLKTSFNEPFFLTIWHEPVNAVRPAAGSGYTAADYAAMYRHVVLRLRADGATKAITVMTYMGFSRWQSMVPALYPGDDVVDWIGWDPYMHNASGTAGHDFAALIDPNPGHDFYSWAITHVGKPLMLAEFGAIGSTPAAQAAFFASVTMQIGQFPELKAALYFNIADVSAARERAVGEQFQTSASGLAAFRAMAHTAPFVGAGVSYVHSQVMAGSGDATAPAQVPRPVRTVPPWSQARPTGGPRFIEWQTS